MPKGATSESRWDERIARAKALAEEHPATREPLTFYAKLAEFQKSLALGFDPDDAPDLDRVVAALPSFLSWLAGIWSAPLAASVARLQALDREQWIGFLDSYLSRNAGGSEELDPRVVFALEAVMQPFAERSAMATPAAPLEGTSFPVRCSACRSLPVVGVLREEGHGARRGLVCALCLNEREFLRLVCPFCGEKQFDVLPIFSADRFEHVRIEACDGCQRYLKTIDMTKNGLAVPLVDDIATVSLDLWARDRGYMRIKTNVLAL